MIKNTENILTKLRQTTDKVILFHSATGKDSIVLLDLLHKKGFKIIPVYMYFAKNITYIDKYIYWAEKKYNVDFIQCPHFVLSNIIRLGEYGLKKDISQKKITLKNINDMVCEKYNVEWTVLGFKKSDGLNRRIMLNELKEGAFNFNTNKCYPLSDWLNKECIAYIKKNKLTSPVIVSKSPSQGCTPNDKDYLLWLEEKHPNDLKKIINNFPEVEAILYQFKYSNDIK
jgi:sulfate adenylyltransferase subunit 2